MIKPIKIAMVGCGRISDLHFPAYASHPNTKLFAVCDVDNAKAMEKAAKWNVSREHIYNDYTRMLRNDQIDAVELLIPHHLHAPMTIEAAEAGKHVSVQKPMANSVHECDEMIRAAQKNDVKLRIFENFRFYPPYIFAKEFIESGRLGRISTIHIKLGSSLTGGWEVPLDAWAWRLDKNQCGGGPICWDDGYHKWSIARWFLGDIKSIYGWIDLTGIQEDNSEPFIDSPAEFIWKYKTPRTYGSMEVSFSREGRFCSDYYSADERIEITGDKGYIWVNQCTAKRLRWEAPIISFVEGELTEYHNIETDWQSSFTNAAHHFIESIINDTIAEVNPEEGKKIQQFAQAAHASCTSHKEESPDKMN